MPRRPEGPAQVELKKAARQHGLALLWATNPVRMLWSQKERISRVSQLHQIVASGLSTQAGVLQMSRGLPAWGRSQWEGLGRELQSGGSLAEGLRRRPGLLDPTTVELMGVGESTGGLERILAQREAQLRRIWAISRTALSKVLAPLGYLAFLVVFVSPLFKLPAAIASHPDGAAGSLFTLYLSQVALNVAPMALVLGAALVTPWVTRALGLEQSAGRLARATPLLGAAIRDNQAARLLLTLGTALSAGLDVERSFQLSGRAMGGTEGAKSVERALAVVRQGGSLTDALRTYRALTAGLLSEVAVGEKTGTLDASLARAAEALWDRFLARVRTLGFSLFLVVCVALVIRVVVPIASGYNDYLHQVEKVGDS